MSSVAPRIGVLALQGDVREHLAALRAAGAAPVPVRRAEELAGLAGIVLPGGESTTVAKLAVTFGVFEPLRQQLGHGLPALGCCAGMILLADRLLGAPAGQVTLGGLDIAVRRNAFGRQVDSFETRVQLDGVGQIDAVFIRAPRVEQTGPAVRVLARLTGGQATAGGAGSIVAVRQGDLLATAFHPELTGDVRVHRYFVEMVKGRELG